MYLIDGTGDADGQGHITLIALSVNYWAGIFSPFPTYLLGIAEISGENDSNTFENKTGQNYSSGHVLVFNQYIYILEQGLKIGRESGMWHLLEIIWMYPT